MAAWAKPKLFWDTMLGSTGSSLAATSTASGYTLTDIYNFLETTMWKSGGTTSPQYITYDAGSGSTKTADYLIILGHNLNTIGATITLQYSTDNFAADVNDAFTGFAPSADTVILKEFTAPAAKRYWRLKISGTLGAAPYMTICIWGNKTELDYATASFDPYEEEAQANISRTQGGVVAGIHTAYTDRRLSLDISDADSTLYNKVKTYRDTHGMRQLFIAWETGNSPNDCWLLYPDEGFRNPLTNGGAYRDISLSFKGRKV